MTHLQSILEQIKQLQAQYAPSSSISTQLQDKSLVMFVAPAATGKTFLMNSVATIDSSFARVPVFTTREPREDDDPGMFRTLPHDEQHLESILAKIRAGELVQYVMHPSGRLYGTEPQDYPGDHNMLATLSDVVGQLSQLPFKQTLAVVVVTDIDIWESWLDARFPKGSSQRQQRLLEAIHSLEWTLARDPSSLIWANNIPGNAEQTAKYIVDVVLGHKAGNDFSYLAEAMLQRAKELV